MPIYEYRCDQGHSFEVMQRMTDEPVQACATCEAPVQRVFHPVAVHFKGSGFYNTDYGKQKRGRGADDGEGTADSGGDAKKADDGKTSGDGKASSAESKDKGSAEAKKSGGDSSSKAASGAGSSTS